MKWMTKDTYYIEGAARYDEWITRSQGMRRKTELRPWTGTTRWITLYRSSLSAGQSDFGLSIGNWSWDVHMGLYVTVNGCVCLYMSSRCHSGVCQSHFQCSYRGRIIVSGVSSGYACLFRSRYRHRCRVRSWHRMSFGGPGGPGGSRVRVWGLNLLKFAKAGKLGKFKIWGILEGSQSKVILCRRSTWATQVIGGLKSRSKSHSKSIPGSKSHSKRKIYMLSKFNFGGTRFQNFPNRDIQSILVKKLIRDSISMWKWWKGILIRMSNKSWLETLSQCGK